MLYFGKSKIWISLILVLGFLPNLSGSTSYLLNDLSPFNSDFAKLENRVFFRLNQKQASTQKVYEQRLKDKILYVASRYRTGLSDHNLKDVSDLILEESKKYGYDPLFLTALIITESSFNTWARSKKGALGLMQIRPTTGFAIASEANLQWRGKKTLYDPEVNIVLGTFYLNKLVHRFGDLTLALEAYNHGPSQLAQFLRKGKQPKRYSKKVFKNYHKIRSQAI